MIHGRYRKKPIVIHALRLPDNVRDAGMPNWFVGRGKLMGDGGLAIETLEGTMMAYPGDWIICGVNGEVYPCKDDIFRKTYEPI